LDGQTPHLTQGIGSMTSNIGFDPSHIQEDWVPKAQFFCEAPALTLGPLPFQ